MSFVYFILIIVVLVGGFFIFKSFKNNWVTLMSTPENGNNDKLYDTYNYISRQEFRCKLDNVQFNSLPGQNDKVKLLVLKEDVDQIKDVLASKSF